MSKEIYFPQKLCMLSHKIQSNYMNHGQFRVLLLSFSFKTYNLIKYNKYDSFQANKYIKNFISFSLTCKLCFSETSIYVERLNNVDYFNLKMLNVLFRVSLKFGIS